MPQAGQGESQVAGGSVHSATEPPPQGRHSWEKGVSKRGNLRALIGTGDPVSLVRSMGSGFKSRLCILLAV